LTGGTQSWRNSLAVNRFRRIGFYKSTLVGPSGDACILSSPPFVEARTAQERIFRSMDEPGPSPTPGASHEAPEDQIGPRIASRRTSKGLNHDGLSKLTKLFDLPSKAGISRTTIRGYEIGLYKPGTRELRLLSQALEVTPTWLIFGGSEESAATDADPNGPQATPQSEVQKFLVALHLLRALDPRDRDVVYDVLHTISRHKHGEGEYRAGIYGTAEIGGLLVDIWNDAKETGKFDQERFQELITAYLPYLDKITEEITGKTLSSFRKPPLPKD
jgi:transcriptional regulator with XRE-family HTH domain